MAAIPTQQGTRGITFDFNLGARVMVPEGDWRVRLSDLETGNILFETETKGAFVNSANLFYVRFGIEVWEGAELDAYPERGAGRDRGSAVGGAGALAEARGVLYWAVERVGVARLGCGDSGGDDQWLHLSEQRVQHALSGGELACLQLMLERSEASL